MAVAHVASLCVPTANGVRCDAGAARQAVAWHGLGAVQTRDTVTCASTGTCACAPSQGGAGQALLPKCWTARWAGWLRPGRRVVGGAGAADARPKLSAGGHLRRPGRGAGRRGGGFAGVAVGSLARGLQVGEASGRAKTLRCGPGPTWVTAPASWPGVLGPDVPLSFATRRRRDAPESPVPFDAGIPPPRGWAIGFLGDRRPAERARPTFFFRRRRAPERRPARPARAHGPQACRLRRRAGALTTLPPADSEAGAPARRPWRPTRAARVRRGQPRARCGGGRGRAVPSRGAASAQRRRLGGACRQRAATTDRGGPPEPAPRDQARGAPKDDPHRATPS